MTDPTINGNWMQNLKPGDKVAVVNDSRSHASYSFKTVVKISPKLGHITLEDGSKWEPRFGYAVGGSGYNRSYIAEITDQLRIAHHKNSLRYKASVAIDQATKYLRSEDQDIAILRQLVKVLADCGFEYKKPEETAE